MSIWDKFPDYSVEELRTLTAVAAETLIDSAEDAGIAADVLRLSSKSVAMELQSLLQESIPGVQAEQFRAAFDDPEQAQWMALAVLGEVRQIPPLAEVVSEAYRSSRPRDGRTRVAPTNGSYRYPCGESEECQHL